MTGKEYSWEDGAELEEHTKKKHEILRKYFRQYLITRCQLPQQEKFRLAIVDGFAGAGIYKGGHYGSPLIFVDVLKQTTDEINITRIANGIRPIQIECLLLLNDLDKSAVDQLRKNITPLYLSCSEGGRKLQIELDYQSQEFETLYPQIKQRLNSAKCSNVLFNLDQCGYSHVTSSVIRDIITSWKSAEVILTFMIGSMLAYLSPNKDNTSVPVEPEMKAKIKAILSEGGQLGKKQWLGEAEKIAFAHMRNCATYVSPFSINNPDGWRYWLMHFANSYRKLPRQADTSKLERLACC